MKKIYFWLMAFVLIAIYIGGAILVGQDIIGFGVELILAVLILGIISAVITGIINIIPFIVRMAGAKIPIRNIYTISFLIIFGFFLGAHFYMSAQLKPLKQKFNEVAIHGSSSVERVELIDGGQKVYLDYGGALDTILDVRDDFLFRHHFLRFGKWWVTDDMPSFHMVYIFIPFLRMGEK